MTSTFCAAAATCMVKFNRTCWEMPNATCLYVCFRKPVSVAVTVYVPGCRLANRYAPASLDKTVVTIPVPSLVAVISTPGTKAPDASATVPPSLAFCDWARALAHTSRQSAATAAVTRNIFIFLPLLKLVNQAQFGKDVE